jgi:hypothetical protein
MWLRTGKRGAEILGSSRGRSSVSAVYSCGIAMGLRRPADATNYAELRRLRQRSSLRFWSVKSSCPAQVAGCSSSGIGAIQMRVRPSQRCAKMLWPHFRHFGMRFMTLLHVCGAGHVARVEQGSARAVKGGAQCAKPTHMEKWARRTLTACAMIGSAGML